MTLCFARRRLNPSAPTSLLPSWAVVNGGRGLGIVVAHNATRLAIKKARQTGIGMVNVNNSHHFGAAGYYSMLCATEGLLGLAMSNGDPIMAVTGSSGRTIGNNPFSYAVPAGKYGIVALDICMSQVADGKIQIASREGQDLPAGWIVDGQGQPSTNPADYLNGGGALLPFGAHKGYGLAVMVECFAGILSGAAITSDVHAWNKSPGESGNVGHVFAVLQGRSPNGRINPEVIPKRNLK